MEDLWAALERKAPVPTSDPKAMIREIVQDRIATRSEGIQLRPRGEHQVAKKSHETEAAASEAVVSHTEGSAPETSVESLVESTAAAAEPEAAAAAATAPKHRPIPKEAKYAETSVITLQTDPKDPSKTFGAEHNPKKPGSASHERFARYKDGMTVKEALDVGLLRGDLDNDHAKGYIKIV